MNEPDLAKVPEAPRKAASSWGATILFGALALGFLIFVWRWDKPWEGVFASHLAKGSTLRVADYVQLGLWGGAIAAAIVFGMLALLGRWWVPLSRSLPVREARSPRIGPAWLGLVVCAMLLATFLRVPLMPLSMQRDESDTLVRNVHGILLVKADGTTRFRVAGWREALWENAGANNPVLFTILARGGTEIWRKWTGNPRESFNAVVLRWPSFVAGILGCAAIAWLGAVLGFPWAGVLAAFLLAIHPWHVRYSTEGRGYALAMLFLPLCVGAMVEAARTGRWRWWIGFAAALFCTLYSFPGAIYAAGVLAAAAVYLILSDRSPTGVKIAQLVKFTVTNATSGALYLFLMGPCAPQILNYLKLPSTMRPMGASWGCELLGAMASGIHLGLNYPAPPAGFANVYDIGRFGDAPGALLFVAAILPLLWIGGAFRLARSSSTGFAVTAVALCSPLLAFAHNAATGHYLYPWYLIFALPFLSLLVGLTLEALCLKLPKGAARTAGGALIILLFGGCFWHYSGPPRRELHRGTGAPFMEYKRGEKVDRVYPEGKITRSVATLPPRSEPPEAK